MRGTFAFLRAATSGRLLAYLRELSQAYGPVSSVPLGTRRIVFVDDAALVESVLVTRQHAFVRDDGARLLRELVGEGLLTTDDPAHLRRRRVMQPSFHRARVAAYAPLVVAETDRITAAWRDDVTIDAGAEMARLTLAAVGAALFGTDLRGDAAAVAEVLARVTQRGTSLGALLAFAGPALGPLHRLFPGRESLLFPRERARLDAIVAPLVARAGREGGENLLALLLEARDETGAPLGDAAVRNEAVMLILAGHETTANALTWTWYCLAEHPPVLARLQAELDAVLGGRAPEVSDLPNLPYAAAVFDEALRLYPPAAAFARRPLHDVELGGYRIAAGTSVFVSPYVTQRNERYYGAPETFHPGRRFGKTPPKFAFFPFGGGSKTCIGEPFARLEALLVIARIASRYTLRRTETVPLEPGPQALLRPDRPLLVRPVARTAARA